MKPKQLKSFLKKAIPARLPVLIKGQPGVGKSAIVEQVCRELGVDLITTHPVVSEPIDYKGMPCLVGEGDEKRATFLPFGDLQRLIEAEKPTVYFIDDFGQAPKMTQAALMQLLLARQINGHKISDQVTFVAATNRLQDKAAVSGLIEPVKSRFITIVELKPDLEDWIEWALRDGNIPPELVAFIRFRPDFLHSFKPTYDLVNTPSPRAIAHVGRLMRLVEANPELKDIEFELYSGAAGEDFATELIGFLKVCREMEDPEFVIEHPDEASVPTDPSVLYALCAALAYRADKANFGNIIRYANRLPAEFSVLLVKDCIRRNPRLQSTKELISWIKNHQEYFI